MASRRKARAAYAAAAAAALLLLAAVTFAQRAGFAGASYAARMEADEALVAREAQLQAQRLSAAWGHASSAGHAQVQGTAATASGSVVTSAEDSILAEIAALQDELRGFRGAVEGNAGAGKANVAAATAAKSEPAEGSFAARVAAEEAALKGSGGSAGSSEGWGALWGTVEAAQPETAAGSTTGATDDIKGAGVVSCPKALFARGSDVNGTLPLKAALPCGLGAGARATLKGFWYGGLTLELLADAEGGQTEVVYHLDARERDPKAQGPALVQNDRLQPPAMGIELNEPEWGQETRCGVGAAWPLPLSASAGGDGAPFEVSLSISEGSGGGFSVSIEAGSGQERVCAWNLRRAAARVSHLVLRGTFELERLTVHSLPLKAPPPRAVATAGRAQAAALHHRGHHYSAADVPYLGPNDAPELQRPVTPGQSVELFIGVLSGARNAAKRDAARRSWMRYPSVRAGRAVVRFFIAHEPGDDTINAASSAEAEQYKDLIVMPYEEHYDRIGLKVVGMMSFGTRDVQARFVMKCDDDTYVRVEDVLKRIHKEARAERLYMGSIYFGGGPHRETSSKWYVSREEYARDSYPPFAHGPGYVVSADIADFAARGVETGALSVFKLEDISMALWVEAFGAQRGAIEMVNDKRFNYVGCQRGDLSAHYQSPAQLRCLFDNHRRTDFVLFSCCASAAGRGAARALLASDLHYVPAYPRLPADPRLNPRFV